MEFNSQLVQKTSLKVQYASRKKKNLGIGIGIIKIQIQKNG
jgi:hypothetical protein